MHDSTSVAPLGTQLAAKSPWLVIAVLAHVVLIAVASIYYFEREAVVDDAAPTQIVLAGDKPPPIEVPPPQIVDRIDDIPKIHDLDAKPQDMDEFHPDGAAPKEDGNSDDPSRNDTNWDPRQIADMLPPGGTAIGSGKGFYSLCPSPFTGKGGPPAKYRNRTDGKGPGTRGPSADNLEVDLALRWLSLHQDEDGRWDADRFMKHDTDGEACTGPGNGTSDVGVTGLALLAFLGKGNTLRDGPYRTTLRAGVRWLLEQQDENGLIGQPSSQSYLYGHAIATLALCEAYGLSQHRAMRKPVQRAVDFIAQARNPYGVWRYEPRSPDGDASVTAWMVQALLSAQEFELTVDDAALRTAMVFFDEVTDPANGAAGYTKRGEGSSRPVGKQDRFPAAKTEALTGAVLLCRALMHQDPKDHPVMKLSAETMATKPPVWNDADGSIDMYYWYYATYAMYQYGGKLWEAWSKKLSAAAGRSQCKDGNAKGSWDPVDPWGDDGGRVYATAMMALCLEAHYRYARVLGAR